MTESTKHQALEFYDRFLRLCVERPEYASFSMAKKCFQLEVGRVWESETVESERYLWFVSYALHVFDNVLRECPEHSGAILEQLSYHTPILDECWEKHWRNECGDEVAALVEVLLGTGNA